MLGRLVDFLDDRMGVRHIVKEALDEPVAGGASWSYVFGSGALVLFLVQLATGVALAVYYTPSATDAWASVAYIEREVTMGALVRGIHHHAAGGMIIIVALHMLQTFVFGAYKAPREMNWLSGVALLGLMLAFALTGYLLPWDQTGYWATKVATSIAGTVPVVGEATQRFLQGGNDYGTLTLTRFYVVHVVILPLGTCGLIGLHVLLFRRHGVTPSARKDAEALSKVDPFWPKQVAYDTVFCGLVVAVVLYVAATKGAPLQAPADPASNFVARPEWYFLFLFQLLKYFDGPLQVVGTTIVPGLAAAFVAMLPFIDRAKTRRIKDRLLVFGAVAAGVVIVAALTVQAMLHDANDPLLAAQKSNADREAARAMALAVDGVPVQGAAYMLTHDPLTRGERVFRRECMSCHPFEGSAPDEIRGPELTGYGSKAWIRQVLRDPDSLRLYGATKVSGMKSFAKLGELDLSRLVDALHGLREPDAKPIEESSVAPVIEEQECGNCHDFEEAGALDGPALFGYLSRAWIAAVIDDASADHLYGEANTMPAFKTRLGDEDRSAVVTFVQSIEGRGASKRWPWVDDPGPIPTPRGDKNP